MFDDTKYCRPAGKADGTGVDSGADVEDSTIHANVPPAVEFVFVIPFAVR